MLADSLGDQGAACTVLSISISIFIGGAINQAWEKWSAIVCWVTGWCSAWIEECDGVYYEMRWTELEATLMHLLHVSRRPQPQAVILQDMYLHLILTSCF